MKKNAFLGILILLVGCSCPKTPLDKGYHPLEEVILKARDRVFPALVHISVVEGDFSGGKEVKVLSVGSGVIITAQGHVITNHHVAGKGKHFICTLSDKQDVKADLIGKDPLTDLAVIQLHLNERKDPNRPISVATLGDSDKLEVGEHVMAMGSPLALARSVTLGIVSNTERVFPSWGEMELEDEEPTGIVTRWIQHDSSINPGNSGGPLVNMQGEVIGINELSAGGDMGFAIPSNIVKEVADSIIRTGQVIRSSIGIEVQALPKNFKIEEGILICGVMKDSPAEISGIKAGDVILTFDGKPVRGRFPEEVPLFIRLIANTPVGENIEIKLLRQDGKIENVQLKTVKMEESRGEEKEVRGWGLTVREITKFSAWERLLSNRDGVIVTGVRAGGAAAQAKPSILPDDIICKIGGEVVKDIKSFFMLYDASHSMESERLILLEVERNGEKFLTALKPPEELEKEERAFELPKAWLPVSTQVLTRDLSQALNLTVRSGVRITNVYPQDPAIEADLQVGDIILKIDGEDIPSNSERDEDVFSAMVRQKHIGDVVNLTLLREGKGMDIPVTLMASPTYPKDARRYKDKFLELNVREITFFDRINRKLDKKEKGVLVEGVESGGWAALAQVKLDDIIVKIGDQDTPDIETYSKASEALSKDPPEVIHIVVKRGPAFRFLAMYSILK